jgi:ABC-type transport system involved in cytochrome bd biosynthesis fused ATPase/permease subunit
MPPALILTVVWILVAQVIMFASLFTQHILTGAFGLALWFVALLWADWFFIPLRESKK